MSLAVEIPVWSWTKKIKFLFKSFFKQIGLDIVIDGPARFLNIFWGENVD
jgi:hypothetical protein